MKAIIQDRYGSPDALELSEIDRPATGDGEVLVRVRAASVEPIDVPPTPIPEGSIAGEPLGGGALTDACGCCSLGSAPPLLDDSPTQQQSTPQGPFSKGPRFRAKGAIWCGRPREICESSVAVSQD
jgi:hypothetical protein